MVIVLEDDEPPPITPVDPARKNPMTIIIARYLLADTLPGWYSSFMPFLSRDG